MLAMSTSPTSAGASSTACAATGSSVLAVVLDPCPCWHLLLENSSCLWRELRQKLFDGGGWTAASFSRLAHCVPVLSFPLINRVR
jgi:hypothetical protein